MARDKIHIDLVLNTKGFRPLGRINGQLGEFEKSLDASNARVLAFGASAGAILAVQKAFTATVKAAIEVQKSLQDINVILGATSANLRKFGSDLFEIASKTGQAFQVAATAATELARQGLGTAETLKRTRDALILARLAGMDAAEAVNALTAAINTFNKAGLDSTTIINKLANVDAAFAVSSDDLAKAIGRVGASAKAAGVNFDQLLAIVTTVQQKTARGGAVIGNSFKTIFTRIQRPKVIKQLEDLGIAIRGVEGDVLPAMKVLQNLARQFDNLSQAQKAQITELIGGVFQVNILKAAMSDLGKETGIYNRALAVSIGSSDQALRRNEELNKTLSAQFQRTVNTFKQGAAELGELTLGPALERMFAFVDDMSKIGEGDFGKVGVSIAKSIFEGLGKFISGPGLLVIGIVLFKTFSQLGKFAADAFKTLTGLNKTLSTQQNLQRQVFDVLSENPALLKKIKDGTMTVEQAHEEIHKQITKNTSALDNQLLVSNQLAKSLMGGGIGFSADFGATTGKKSRKFGSAGYIPSFAADRGERLGMMAGGYSGSQVRNPKTSQKTIHDGRGGVFNATVNGHESVFTTQNQKGKKATFVVPPKNSEAYDKYMSVLSGGFVPNFMAFARLKKGTDFNKTLGRGQASFTGKGEDKIFKALGDKRGTTLMLKDGSAVVSDRPLHGMAAMEAGIDPRKIVGGGFHNVRKGQLSFGESDMTDLDELDKVLSGGYIPNFNEAKIKEQRKYLEQLKKENKKIPKGMTAASFRPFASNTAEVDRVFGITSGNYGIKDLVKFAGNAHKEFAHNYQVAQGKDVTGQDEPVEISGTKRYGWRGGKRQEKAGVRVYDAKQKFGLLGLYGTKESNQGYAEASIKDIAKYTGDIQKHSKIKKIGFKNLQYRSVTDSLNDTHQTGQFSQQIRKHYSKPTTDLANEFSKEMLGDDAIKAVKIGAKGSALFPKGTEGEIFETVVNSLTNKNASAASFEKGLTQDRNKTWDFEESGGPENLFRDRFKFSKSILKADAKRTLSKNAGASLVNKIFNTEESDVAGKFAWRSDLDALRRSTSNPKSKKGKAGGYIPNFNALFEAVRREKEAGVPTGRIKVGRSDRLKNGANPSGFGIYNTRDEPMGLNQGINNSMAAGVDPKRKGMSHGFIPNYFMTNPADRPAPSSGGDKKTRKSTDKLTKATNKQSQGAMQTMVLMGMLQQGITGLNNAIGENNNAAKSIVSSIGSLVTVMVAARYAGGEFKSMGMGKLSKGGKARVESGKQELGGALKQRNQAGFRLQKRKDEATFKKEGTGRLGRWKQKSKTGLGAAKGKMMGGLSGAAASGALTAGAVGFAALNQFGKLMSQSDFSATFKEARLAGKSLEKIKEATEKNISKLNKFGTAAERAAKTFEDQNSTMSQVLDASRQMEKELAKLPNEFRGKLAGIFDPAKVNTMIQQFVADQQKKATQAQSRKDSADTLESVRDRDVYDVLANPLDTLGNLATSGNLSGKTKEEEKMDSKQVKGIAAGILQRTIEKNKGKFKGMDTEDFLTKMGGARNEKERMQIGRDLGMSDADLEIWSKWARKGGEDFNKLAKPMAKLIAETKAHYDAEREMGPLREQLLKQNRAQLKAIKEHKKTLESEQRIRKAVIKITAAGAKEFLNAAGKINLDTRIKVGEAKAEKETQFGGLISQTQKALGKASASEKLAGTSLETGIKGTLSQAAAGGVGSVSQTQVDAQTAGLDKMIEEMENSANSQDPLVKQQVTELQNLKAELQNLVGSSERLDDELKMQTKEIKAAAAAQKMVADQQRRLKSFGGPQALLDPSKLNPMLSKITSGGKAMAASGRAGSRTGFNRGMANQLSGVQDLLGGELPENLRKKGVAAATQVGVSQIGAMNQALGLGMSQADVQKIAAEQANNLFKGDPQKQNTSALETLTATLKANNDLVKHSRTDRIDIAGKEGQYSQDSSARQRGYMSSLREYQQGASNTASRQANWAGGMMNFRTKDMRNSQGAGNFSYLDLGLGTSREDVLAARNESNEEAKARFDDNRGARGGGFRRDGQDTQREDETRSEYNERTDEGSKKRGIEGAKRTVKEGAKAVQVANVNVTVNGAITVESLGDGIEGLEELQRKLLQHESALQNMPGGTAALNRELVA